MADAQTSPLIPDADRPAVAAVGVGAFVAAPLIRDGRLIAALVVNDLSPRDWTPEEVELVRDTAERTWEAIERARAEEQLREASVQKGRVPGDAGARTEKSARPDTNGPRTDSARRRHRGGGRASARDDGASSRSHGSLDRRPHGRVENHVRQDCAPTRTNTARRVWSAAPWKPIVPPWLPNESN